MSNELNHMDDTQLNAALDRLCAPLPSDTLAARVRGMTPVPQPVFLTPRRTAAAVLALAIGAAALLQINTVPTGIAPAQPIAAIADPAGEIPVPDLALSEEENPDDLPTEPFSVAGMPLE